MENQPPSYDTETRADIINDIGETLYLLSDALGKLTVFQKTLHRLHNALSIPLVTQSAVQIRQLRSFYADVFDKTRAIQKNILSNNVSSDTFALAETHIGKTRMFLRTHQHILASVITMTDWQSPSFLHALHSQAGRQTNTIYETINDYKRDQHWDAHTYERQFAKEYIDTFVKFPVKVYATVSGMAAFTTILSFLLFETDKTRPVVIGASSYFENKILLHKAFPGRIIEVNETDTDKLLSIITSRQPVAVFLDSITNAPNIPIPDIKRILLHMKKYSRTETYMVVDNTGLPVLFQPIKRIPTGFRNVRLLIFESLNKYHQFGMDRVTGGIIWGYGKGLERLFDYREHLGTNIPDASAVALPTPNRGILSKRLTRHGRNAFILAHTLTRWIDNHPNAPLAAIRYPGLLRQTHTPTSEAVPFYGSYFVIEFKRRYQTIPAYKRFIKKLLANARKQHIDLVCGTSFGLNTTRVYLTAVRAKTTQPFLRVSVGTEHKHTIDRISRLFLDTFGQFR